MGFHSVPMARGPGVIIGRTGTLDSVFYVERDYWPHNTTLWVKDFHGNLPKFIYYFLKGLSIGYMNVGSANPTLNRNHLHQITIRLPPLQEQIAVASILGSLDDDILIRQGGESGGLKRLFKHLMKRLLSGEWSVDHAKEWLRTTRPTVQAYDDKIELNRRMNQTLEEIARALFKFWFVDFGPVRAKAEGRWKKGESLPGMPADMWGLWPSEFEASEIGEIPKGWTVGTLAGMADVTQGSTPSTASDEYWEPPEIDWVTVKDLSSTSHHALLSTARKLSRSGLAKIGSVMVPRHSILLSTGAPIGYFAVTTIPAALGTRVAAIQPHGGVGGHYLRCWIAVSTEEFRDAANGTTFPQLLLSTLREFPIVVPTRDLLSAFDSHLAPISERVVSNCRESATLASTRDALLPKLLSGEIRVPVNGGR
jgi:type I restriction enzyme S subunit